MKLFLFTLILMISSQAFAKTGYVDIMKAFEQSKQGKRVKTQLEQASQKAQKNFKTKEQKLQKEEADLKKEVALMSDQARTQKIYQFQQKVINFQKDAKNKDTELQGLQTKLMNPVLERLRRVIGEIAKKESFLKIENVGADVLWVSPELDLTKKVYKAYNKKYKK